MERWSNLEKNCYMLRSLIFICRRKVNWATSSPLATGSWYSQSLRYVRYIKKTCTRYVSCILTTKSVFSVYRTKFWHFNGNVDFHICKQSVVCRSHGASCFVWRLHQSQWHCNRQGPMLQKTALNQRPVEPLDFPRTDGRLIIAPL